MRGSDITLLIEIAPGELIDRLTILERKLEHFVNDPDRLDVLTDEHAKLLKLRKLFYRSGAAPAVLKQVQDWEYALRTLNRALWDLEDQVRRLAPHGMPSDANLLAFAAAAVRIFALNGQRAAAKRAINYLMGVADPDPKSHVLPEFSTS